MKSSEQQELECVLLTFEGKNSNVCSIHEGLWTAGVVMHVAKNANDYLGNNNMQEGFWSAGVEMHVAITEG